MSCFLDDVSALSACHVFRAGCSNAFNLCPVSSFTITGIAGNHAVIIQEMEILFPTSPFTWFIHFIHSLSKKLSGKLPAIALGQFESKSPDVN
jgi:hypothetical protein